MSGVSIGKPRAARVKHPIKLRTQATRLRSIRSSKLPAERTDPSSPATAVPLERGPSLSAHSLPCSSSLARRGPANCQRHRARHRLWNLSNKRAVSDGASVRCNIQNTMLSRHYKFPLASQQSALSTLGAGRVFFAVPRSSSGQHIDRVRRNSYHSSACYFATRNRASKRARGAKLETRARMTQWGDEMCAPIVRGRVTTAPSATRMEKRRLDGSGEFSEPQRVQAAQSGAQLSRAKPDLVL